MSNTESTVIQPAPGQSILTTSNGHDHHGHRGHDSVEARADFRTLTNEVERFGTANLTSAGVTDRLVQSTACHTDQLVQATGARGVEVSQAGFGVVHDRLCDAKAGIIGALGSGFTASALAQCKTQDGIADVKFIGMETAKDNLIAMNVGFSAGQNGVNTGFAAQSVLATTIGNAQSVLSQSIGNAASVQATNYFNQSTVQLERVRAELDAKQAQGFAAAALLAFQNKADSDAKAAKCCCDGELLAAKNFATLSAQAAENFCKLEATIVREGRAGTDLQRDLYTKNLERLLASIPRGIPVTLAVGV